MSKSGLDNLFFLHKYIWVLFGKIKEDQNACHDALAQYLSLVLLLPPSWHAEFWELLLLWAERPFNGIPLESCISIWNVSHSRATGNLSKHCIDGKLWKLLFYLTPCQHFVYSETSCSFSLLLYERSTCVEGKTCFINRKMWRQNF